MKRWLPFVVATVAACNGESEETLSVEELMDPATCKECHEDHYTEWSGSMHAYAATDPVFLAMNQRGQEETGGDLGNFCVKCHAPLAVELGLTEDGTDLDQVPDHLKGVTCYFCHNVESVNGEHNNPLVLAMDKSMRGPFPDAVKNPAHRSEYSPLLDGNDDRSSSLCGPCHDIVVPDRINGVRDVHLERTFEEFKQTLFAKGPGKLSCSNCHMEGSPGVVADFDGVKSRVHHSHLTPGVDVAITDFPDRERQLDAVQRFLDTSIRAELCVRPTGGIRVVLDNVSAGHHFPSGASQDRRVWVEVIAYDANGGVLYETGVVADDEPIVNLEGPNLWLLRDKTFDAQGNTAHMFWDVAEVDSSETLPGPRTTSPIREDGTEDPDFHIELRERFLPGSESAGIPARITLRIRIRPIGLDVLDDLIESGHLEERFRDASVTHDLLPDRESRDVTLEWTSDDLADECIRTSGQSP